MRVLHDFRHFDRLPKMIVWRERNAVSCFICCRFIINCFIIEWFWSAFFRFWLNNYGNLCKIDLVLFSICFLNFIRSFGIYTANSFRLICVLSNDTHHCENQLLQWADLHELHSVAAVSSPILLYFAFRMLEPMHSGMHRNSTKAQSNRVQWVKVQHSEIECILRVFCFFFFFGENVHLILIVERVHFSKSTSFRLSFVYFGCCCCWCCGCNK